MVLKTVQRRMIGHAALILLVGFVAGVGLLASLLGGLELLPGHILPVAVAGDAATWARAHVGGMMNALLVIAIAVCLPVLDFNVGAASRLGWALIGAGWANTLFYWAALFTSNRALTFGPNRFGDSNWASVVGLAPALVFVIISIAVAAIVARQAFSNNGIK